MSVDIIYEILNYCETARDVFAWMEAVDDAYIPGLGRIPALDYIPTKIQKKFCYKLILDDRPFILSSAPIYKKYGCMINWFGSCKKYRRMTPDFATACENCIEWDQFTSQLIYFDSPLLRVVKDKVRWRYIEYKKLSDDILLEFKHYIDWRRCDSRERVYTAKPDLIRAIFLMLPKSERIDIIYSKKWYGRHLKLNKYKLPHRLSYLLEAITEFPDLTCKVFQLANEHLGPLDKRYVDYWFAKYKRRGVIDGIRAAFKNVPIRVCSDYEIS